jgi:hypothetical protein
VPERLSVRVRQIKAAKVYRAQSVRHTRALKSRKIHKQQASARESRTHLPEEGRSASLNRHGGLPNMLPALCPGVEAGRQRVSQLVGSTNHLYCETSLSLFLPTAARFEERLSITGAKVVIPARQQRDDGTAGLHDIVPSQSYRYLGVPDKRVELSRRLHIPPGNARETQSYRVPHTPRKMAVNPPNGRCGANCPMRHTWA